MRKRSENAAYQRRHEGEAMRRRLGLSGCGNPDRTAGTAGKTPCKHGQQETGSARQSEQEDKNHTYRRCATAGRPDTDNSTSAWPPLATAQQPTLRISDDNDYDDVDHNDNGAATNDDSAHYKQADTTHN